MNPRLCASLVLLGCLLVCALPALAQDTNTHQKGDVSPMGPIIGGDGVKNYIPVWSTPLYLQNSVIYQDASKNVGVGTTTPAAKLDVNGDINAAGRYEIGGSPVVTVNASAETLFMGTGAGASNVNGYQSTFVGINAGYSNVSAGGNAFFGNVAGYKNTDGEYNTFIGAGSGTYNVSGEANTFVGKETGHYSTGNENTFIGAYGGASNTSGFRNTFVGSAAGVYNSTGNFNVYLDNTGPNSGTESNTIRIGDPRAHFAAYMAGIYGSIVSSGVLVYVNSDGQLGTSSSSLRFKEQVRNMGDSTNALMKLRPVTFFYKPEYSGERTMQYGLIAEDVAKVYPELVAYDKEGQPYSVRYQYLTAMLLNELQKQYRRTAELEQRVSQLEKLVGSQLPAVAPK